MSFLGSTRYKPIRCTLVASGLVASTAGVIRSLTRCEVKFPLFGFACCFDLTRWIIVWVQGFASGNVIPPLSVLVRRSPIVSQASVAQ